MFFANVYKIGACVWDSMRALASLRQIPPFTLPHGLGNVYPLPLKILLNVWTVAKEYEKEAVYIHIVMEAIEAEFELIFFVPLVHIIWTGIEWKVCSCHSTVKEKLAIESTKRVLSYFLKLALENAPIDKRFKGSLEIPARLILSFETHFKKAHEMVKRFLPSYEKNFLFEHIKK